MDTELAQACASHGWDALYEEAMAQAGKDLSQETSSGERRAQSPFPFCYDRNPSFSVNMRTGFWRDWHVEKNFGIKGGNYVQFMALMNARIDPKGAPLPDYKETERALRIRFGLSRSISEEWLRECQEALKDPECPGHRLWLNARKRWTRQILVEMGIGYDEFSKRLVIPCHDRNGDLVNARLYLPGAPDRITKMFWQQTSMAGNFLFPPSARNENYVILVEGESDVITLRQFGYNAASGTLGAGNPVPETESKWYVDKEMYVLMDADEPGIEAAAHAIMLLEEDAKSIVRIDLPDWPDRPGNADISDWIGHLLDIGYDDDQVRRELSEHIQNSQVHNAILSHYDQKSRVILFSDALSAQNVKDKLEIKAQVIAKGNARYMLPMLIDAVCPTRGHEYCVNCAMKTRYKGHAQLKIDPRSPMALKLIQIDDERQLTAIKKDAGIVDRCPDLKPKILESVDVDTALLVSTMDEDEDNRDDGIIEKPRREAYILSYKGGHLADTTDYVFEGFIYPTPKTQKLVFLLETARRVSSKYDTMSVTDDVIDILRQFQSDVPYDMMQTVASDISLSSTLIVGRADLHMLYRTVWYSLISFQFMGQVIDHGWIEALVVGDTRCGKSATFKRMSSLFGTGELVDCKMQTAPGVLGAVETSNLTGERYVVPGIMPRQDRRGPIAFDEFSASADSRNSMMDHMSSTRAEGKVKIVKAASAEFWARVRQIYLTNPGQGKLMSDIGGYGVETILKLISQPEDIARFDIAMVVTQGDVSVESLNTVRHPEPPRFSMQAHRLLLQWAWSRRPEQVVWAPNAEQAVVGLATAMYQKYDQSIPLVEPADQRMRIARIAVSIAAQSFSTDSSFQNVVVKPEHVAAASSLYRLLYDKPSMGYDMYSIKVKKDRSIANEDAIVTLFDTRFGKHSVTMAEKLLRTEAFTLQSFQLMVPMHDMDTGNTLQTLSANRCIRQKRSIRTGTSYECTSQFVRFLEQYIHKKSVTD